MVIALSYERHDGRELELMLSGKKPMAFFSVDADASLEEDPDLFEFEAYAKSGAFGKGEYIVEGSVDPRTGYPVRTKFIVYTTDHERWRIPAMVLTLKTTAKTRVTPCEGLDRLVGSLLGYTDEQNDEYVSKMTYNR